jgi:hypothetical protein
MVKDSSAGLVELLTTQLDNYREALELENELSVLIEKGDYQSVPANTEKKTALMRSIEEIHKRLLPLLQKSLDKEGKIPDREAERRRLEAISVLRELQKLEAENLAKLEGGRARLAEHLKVAQTAKRTARSYKPKSGKTSRYLDTKE